MKTRQINPKLPGRVLAAGVLALSAVPSAWAQPASSRAPAGEQAPAVPAGEAGRQVRRFNIPAQPLAQAVLDFARQAGIDLYIGQASLAARTSVALQGSYSITAGLTQLLGDAPIGYRYRLEEGGNRLNVQLYNRPAAGGSGAVHALGAVVVVGDAPEQWVYETPRAVSVITRQDMDRTPALHAADLLQDTPGVTSAVSRQNPGLSVNIRGMQDFGRVNMMIDGMRQNFVQNGHMQRNGEMYIDSELLSEVVIERGVRADVHSTGALAGSVDFRSLDFADILRDDHDVGVRLRGNTGLGGEGNGVNFLGSAAGAARVGENLELLAAYSRRSIGDYKIGTHGDDDNIGWVDGGLEQFNDVKFASQRQNSNLFKARWQLDPAQSLQFTYIGTRVSYSNVTDAGQSLSDGTPWRSLGTSGVESDSYALDYKLRPAGNNWLDLNLKLYGVDTSNRNYTDPSYPRSLDNLTDPDLIREWVDGAWNRGNCEGATIVDDYKARCSYGLGVDNRIRTKTYGAQLDNTSRFTLGEQTVLSANYGIEYFSDRATSNVQLDHNGRTVDQYNPYGKGDPLNPQGRRSMGSIFTNLTLEDDFYTVSAGLRYERYWLKGDTQVPGTHNEYRSRFDMWKSYLCTGSSAIRKEGCAVALAGGESALIPWANDHDPRGYYRSGKNFTPSWEQVNGLYEREVDRSEGKLLPSLSAAIRPASWLELYASWGKAWRPPAINESLMVGAHPGDSFAFMYPNPDAEPETSRTWEVGANTIFQNVLADSDRLALKLGYFDTKAQNYLFSSLNNNTPGLNMNQLMGFGKVAFVNNRATTRFRGLEFEGRYDAGWIYGGLSYTHYIGGPNEFCQDLYFAGSGSSVYDQRNEDGSYTPEHQMAVAQGYKSWQAWADDQVVCSNFVYNSAIAKPVDKGMALVGVRLFERKLDTGVRLTYSGDGWYNRDTGGSQVWTKYFTLDWYASYQATDNVKLMASIENLTDRMYRDGYSDALARTYAPGRTVLVGMEIRY